LRASAGRCLARRKGRCSLCGTSSRIQDLDYLGVKIRHSATLPIDVYCFALAVCGVSTRFMKAYALNCAALRRGVPSRLSFGQLVHASLARHLPALPNGQLSEIRPFSCFGAWPFLPPSILPKSSLGI
jgi:hypothetical protein